ncbi:MAG: HAD family hydrolase [Chloroflexota bacterium]
MIRAVFFDLYNTLVRYEPPREELLARTLAEFGIKSRPEEFARPFLVADEFMHQEQAKSPLSKRSRQEKMDLYARHQEIVLEEAGIETTQELIKGLLGKMMEVDLKLIPFDDVVPSLTELKDKGLTLGLISNDDRDLRPLCDELGISSLIEVVVTSRDAGKSKPQPEIFQEALRRAGVEALEAVYVGDQYKVDVVGAEQAGMKGILLDRGGFFPDAECPRISALDEVVNQL